MPLLDILTDRLRRHPKRIVFPEGSDPRILQAARQFISRELGVPILLGDRTVIKRNASALNINLDGIRFLEPARSEDFNPFLEQLAAYQRFASKSPAELRALLATTGYFAALMVKNGQASGLVAGATITASNALRPLIQLLPIRPGVRTVSSLQMLDFEEPVAGGDGVLFLADCAVIPDPGSAQLADIALTAGSLALHLTGQIPRIAFLSFTTHSLTSTHPSVLKMQDATRIAREKAAALGLQVEIDGELQVDAALLPAVAQAKGVDGPVAGRANVLIFPDLQAANIGSKLAQILTGARTYGSILTGLNYPAAEISRGASAHDIFGTAVMIGAQAIDPRLLHPTGEISDAPPHELPHLD